MAKTTLSRARAMPRRSPRKPPRVARVARRVAGMQTPRKAVGPPKRKVGENVKTPMRWRIITAYLQLSSGKLRLPRRGMEKLKKAISFTEFERSHCAAPSAGIPRAKRSRSYCWERQHVKKARPMWTPYHEADGGSCQRID